jgi:hypothetical protein
MEPHEMAFFSKVLEHAEDNPEEQRTIVDATMNAFFGKARKGVPKNDQVENTIKHMLSHSGWSMKELVRSLSFGCKKELDKEKFEQMIERDRKNGREYNERQLLMMQEQPPQYCCKKPMHRERSNITTSIRGYLLKVYHHDFSTGFMTELGWPQYFANYIQGIILEPEFGRYTRQMIEALNELHGIQPIRKDPVEAMSNVYETISDFELEELKDLRHEIDYLIEMKELDWSEREE